MRFLGLSLFSLLACGCGGGNAASPSATDSGVDVTPVEDGGGGGSDAPTGDAPASGEAGAPVSVTFAYTPQWDGVTKVDVVGGFGQASDWSKTQSFLALTKGAGGTWSGSAMLPPGTYLYVFRVTGDAQAAMPANYPRYAVDPLQTAFAACPMQSPTYSKIDKNPCSQLTVTASGGPAPATGVHVKGTVMLDGAAAMGWMVVLEREETMTATANHHYFANRLTTGNDGSFDLVASMGHYRLQIQAPTLLSQTDLDRDPTSLNTLRRAISASFPIAASDLMIPSPDVGFHAYAQFAPTGDGGSLPTQFSFENGTSARLDLYGGPGDGGVVDIGDPWFASAPTTDGGAVFGGDFTTMQAMQDAAAPGTRYMWGTEEPYGADASVAWTNQSLVFPIVWH
ncbi:MAG TPA: hypothetical protein VF765_07870 [Polyangiaceae bacterium]